MRVATGKDGIQLIPFSEVAAKDELASIKNINCDDMLAALPIPSQFMRTVPQNAGGCGTTKDAAQIWAINELDPRSGPPAAGQQLVR